MATEIITLEDLNQFKKDLFQELRNMIEGMSKQEEKPTIPAVLKSHEVMRLLGISPGTLQNLRVNGTLPFAKVGGVILYQHSDIIKMIEENRHNLKPYGKHK